LRGQVDDRDGHAAPFADDDETGCEPLPMMVGRAERRLQVRAYSLWTGLLGDRRFPALSTFVIDTPADLAPFGVLIDFSAGNVDPAISRIGAALADECGPPGSIARLSDAPDGSLLSRIADHYHEILTRPAPVGFEAEFVNWRGATVLYRGILLPFSSDGEAIDHVFGVVNWKELADTHIAQELQFEIEAAIGPLRRLRLEPVPDGDALAGRVAPPSPLDSDIRDRLRTLDVLPFSALPAQGPEFAMLLAHRAPGGEIALIGEVPDDPRLLEHAARRLLG
jgi:hypothetical protein